MNIRRAVLVCALALLSTAAAPAPPPLFSQPVPQTVIDGAEHTLAAMRAGVGQRYDALLRASKAVLIAPRGDKGDAVLLVHNKRGWSEPAFFAASALPDPTPSVVLMMSERALDAILHQRGLTLDGPAGLTIATTTAKDWPDFRLWPQRHPKLAATGFIQDDAANTAWYGHPRSAPEIVGDPSSQLRSSRLRGLLDVGRASVRPAAARPRPPRGSPACATPPAPAAGSGGCSPAGSKD
jgi:hypothetical protein